MAWRFGIRLKRTAGSASPETVKPVCQEQSAASVCMERSLPIETCKPAAAEASQTRPEDGPVIIAVDDESIILNGNVWVLNRTFPNAEIHGFLTAPDALAFARTRRIDVAFLDVELQASNGLVLAGELERLNPEINVIIVSSHTQYMDDAMQANACGFLTKPLKQEKVLQGLQCLRHPVMGLL